MAAAMTMGKAMGMVPQPLPLKVERRLEERVGVADQTNRRAEQGLALGEHMLISAAFGAGYGMLRSTHPLAPMPAGPLYGLGVYALNVEGIGPRLGATREPQHQQPMTVGQQLMMHLMYGTVTALVAEQIRQGRAESERPVVMLPA